MKKTTRVITILMFIFLYLPMVVMIVASFNTSKDITSFEGFTLQQYVRLFQDRSLPVTPAAAGMEEAVFILFSFSSLSQHTDKMSQMYTQGLK